MSTKNQGWLFIVTSLVFLFTYGIILIFFFYEFELFAFLFLPAISIMAAFYLFAGVKGVFFSPHENDEGFTDMVSHSKVTRKRSLLAKRIKRSNIIVIPLIGIVSIILMEVCGSDMGCFAYPIIAIIIAGIYLVLSLITSSFVNTGSQGKLFNFKNVYRNNFVYKGLFKIFFLITLSLLIAVILVAVDLYCFPIF